MSNKRTALIGYTGFVGGNILHENSFDDMFNSKNIGDIENKQYDLVVNAGTPGIKWLANKEPENDRKQINKLLQSLKTIKANKFIHISTIDVYPEPNGVNELSDINAEKLLPYGKHRFWLENEITRIFPSVLIVRLPALFGNGIKKNLIYDLINNQATDYTHPDSTFPFYNLKNIWKDICISLNNDIKLINFATEPLKANIISEKSVGTSLNSKTLAKKVNYDIKTVYSHLFGIDYNDYIYLKDQIMNEIIGFIRKERRKIKKQ